MYVSILQIYLEGKPNHEPKLLNIHRAFEKIFIDRHNEKACESLKWTREYGMNMARTTLRRMQKMDTHRVKISERILKLYVLQDNSQFD